MGVMQSAKKLMNLSSKITPRILSVCAWGMDGDWEKEDTLSRKVDQFFSIMIELQMLSVENSDSLMYSDRC